MLLFTNTSEFILKSNANQLFLLCLCWCGIPTVRTLQASMLIYAVRSVLGLQLSSGRRTERKCFSDETCSKRPLEYTQVGVGVQQESEVT